MNKVTTRPRLSGHGWHWVPDSGIPRNVSIPGYQVKKREVRNMVEKALCLAVRMEWYFEESQKSDSFPLGNKAQIDRDPHFRFLSWFRVKVMLLGAPESMKSINFRLK